MPLAGKPMVEWSLAAFRGCGAVGSILVACPPGHLQELDGHDLGVIEGGETRSQSVAKALGAVGTELVAIHDAARPLLTAQLVADLVATLVADPEADGAIAATPVTDTVKRAELAGDDHPGAAAAEATKALVVESTLDRGRLWAAQTPQLFRVDALRRALGANLRLNTATTDEAMLVEAAGGRVLIHPAPPENLKVTTPLDLRLAELLLSSRSAE